MKPDAAEPISFRSRDPGYFYELHNESRRQYVITLSGQSRNRDRRRDEKLRFGPGYVIFAVGLAGQGLKTRTIGNEPWVYCSIASDQMGNLPAIGWTDSSRLAYVAGIGEKQIVVVDGHEGKQYDIIFGRPEISSDSKIVAYVAGVEGKQVMVVDGQEGDKFDHICSSDGRKFVFGSPVELHYFALWQAEKGYDFETRYASFRVSGL